jgi:hypothetical protein
MSSPTPQPQPDRRLSALLIDGRVSWPRPGAEARRWLLLGVVGILMTNLAIAYLVKDAYQIASLPNGVYYLTLQFLPRSLRGLLFVLLWLGLLGFSMMQGRYGGSGSPREESSPPTA